jgi:hypothetical protein
MFRYRADGRAPAPVEDDELAGGDVILPDAQACAVHGGIQLLPRILGQPLQSPILLQQLVIGSLQLFVCHEGTLPGDKCRL